MDFAVQFEAYRQEIEAAIDRFLPAAKTKPERLHEAMRYAMLGGGKRLRPILALAAADLFHRENDPLPAAVAIECVHTYSLVHDDLPAMDNDDLRHGRPAVHKHYDEATAILVGDALQEHAFSLLAFHYQDTPSIAARLVAELATAAGSSELVGGQMADLLAEKKANVSAAELDFIHANKTAAMVRAALYLGGVAGGASTSDLARLATAGRSLGLAFQIVDDILDVTADSATLGKTAGKDKKADKTTYVKLHGLEASRRFVHQHTANALKALAELPSTSRFLHELVESMAVRES